MSDEPEDQYTSNAGWTTYHKDPLHKLTVKPTDAFDPVRYQASCSCGGYRSEWGELEAVTEQGKAHRTEVRNEIELCNSVLALHLDPDNDSGASTVRGFLAQLLLTVWAEEGDFSGKRAFGNSGWQYDVYRPMVQAGFITGEVEDGEVVSCDTLSADQLLFKAIRHMCGMKPSPKRIRQED